MPIQFQKYLGIIILFIKQQKMLAAIGGITIIMLISVASLSLIGSNSHQNPAGVIPPAQTAIPGSSSTTPTSNQQASPPPADAPLTTKFIYFIGGLFPGKKSAGTDQNNTKGSAGRSVTAGSSQNISTRQELTTAPNPTNSPGAGSSNGSSGGSSGGGSSSNNGQINNPAIPTPTPVTDVKIIFTNQDGTPWTYVPPAVPPIDTEWILYTNLQDHYSLEYPAGWTVIKSNYNGHEGITIYMPSDAGNIDKPSIAFVGWKNDYLASSASYTGQIIVNNTPGTIYTNGPIGPSSAAAVFEYSSGFFAIGSSKTDPIFIYVFDHMLRSIKFNI